MLYDVMACYTIPLDIAQPFEHLSIREAPLPKLQLFGHATWPHRSYKPLQVDNPQLPSALQNAKEPLLTKNAASQVME